MLLRLGLLSCLLFINSLGFKIHEEMTSEELMQYFGTSNTQVTDVTTQRASYTVTPDIW